MRLSLRHPTSALLLCVVAATLPPRGAPPPPPPRAPPAVAKTNGKKALTIPDYARWRSIGSVAISDDGAWATYGYSQRNLDDTLFLKSFATGTDTRIPRATGPQFSHYSPCVAY